MVWTSSLRKDSFTWIYWDYLLTRESLWFQITWNIALFKLKQCSSVGKINHSFCDFWSYREQSAAQLANVTTIHQNFYATPAKFKQRTFHKLRETTLGQFSHCVLVYFAKTRCDKFGSFLSYFCFSFLQDFPVRTSCSSVSQSQEGALDLSHDVCRKLRGHIEVDY